MHRIHRFGDWRGQRDRTARRRRHSKSRLDGIGRRPARYAARIFLMATGGPCPDQIRGLPQSMPENGRLDFRCHQSIFRRSGFAVRKCDRTREFERSPIPSRRDSLWRAEQSRDPETTGKLSRAKPRNLLAAFLDGLFGLLDLILVTGISRARPRNQLCRLIDQIMGVRTKLL